MAHLVWAALGQPKHYIEPFFGSGAVLLARPGHDPRTHVETVNDADGLLCNVWRSLQYDPDGVARWADWPVNHADLMARKRALLASVPHVLDGLASAPEWYDARLAGYWIWAASCWIGSGMTCPGQRPHLGNSGKGVHKLGQIPHVTHSGMGVHKLGKIPHLIWYGMGVHKGALRRGPDPERHVQEPYNTNIYAWFRALSERLRYVRVVCGDWSRVCGGDWQDKIGDVGIFLDPPYSDRANRDARAYDQDSLDVAHRVREWAVERGARPTYRIVLAGYAGEHEALADHGWTAHNWTAQGGYANQGGGRGKENRKREMLWFSPHCTKTKLF